MTCDRKKHHRHSIRLSGYDYSRAGAYFVTTCTQNRICLFGDIVHDTMQLNDAGKMIRSVWNEMPAHYDGIKTDAFTVMPNHIHGIIHIVVGATPRGCPNSTPRGCPDTGHACQDNPNDEPNDEQQTGQPQGVAPTMETTAAGLSLPDVVHRLKTMTTKKYADGVKQSGWPPFPGKLWQRNYWEHIVRNEQEINRIRTYIHHNPAQWTLDTLHLSDGDNVREFATEYAAEAWMI